MVQRTITPLDGSELVDPDYLGTGSPDGTKVLYGDQTWGSPAGVADITDLPTAETDNTLVLAPDGVGGVEFRAETGGVDLSGIDYLVGTASGLLSAEIAVGTTPGGELGGTWASPTVDSTHSGSSHAGVVSTHEAASDPHTGYQKESEKDAANGYAGLNASSIVPIARLASGTPDGTKFVRDDNTLAVPSTTDPLGYTNIVKSVDQDVTNAQNTDDSELQFSVTSTKIYVVEGILWVSGNDTTGDFECRFAVSAGTMDGRGHYSTVDTGLAYSAAGIAATAAANTSNISTGVVADLGYPTAVRFAFPFRQNTSNGTWKIQFGNNSASAGRTSRMLKGSYIRYKQIN